MRENEQIFLQKKLDALRMEVEANHRKHKEKVKMMDLLLGVVIVASIAMIILNIFY